MGSSVAASVHAMAEVVVLEAEEDTWHCLRMSLLEGLH